MDHNAERVTPSQADVLAWVRSRWPDRCTPERRALKVAEEAGEAVGAVNRLDEGRGSVEHVGKESAQTVLCVMALAEAVGFDLAAEVRAEWAAIQQREWVGALPPSDGKSNDVG